MHLLNTNLQEAGLSVCIGVAVSDILSNTYGNTTYYFQLNGNKIPSGLKTFKYYNPVL